MGYRCLQMPDSAAYLVGSSTTGGQDSDFAIYHRHRNTVCAFVKNMPGALLWILLPLHLVLNLAAIAFFVKKDQGRVVLRAQRDALRGLPRMWKKRQYTQQIRTVPIRKIWRLVNKTALPTRANRGKI